MEIPNRWEDFVNIDPNDKCFLSVKKNRTELIPLSIFIMPIDSAFIFLWVRPLGYMSFRPTPFQPLQFQPLTLSTAGLFDRLQIQPLANSTATNSTYLIKFKVIQIFQDVRKQVK